MFYFPLPHSDIHDYAGKAVSAVGSSSSKSAEPSDVSLLEKRPCPAAERFQATPSMPTPALSYTDVLYHVGIGTPVVRPHSLPPMSYALTKSFAMADPLSPFSCFTAADLKHIPIKSLFVKEERELREDPLRLYAASYPEPDFCMNRAP